MYIKLFLIFLTVIVTIGCESTSKRTYDKPTSAKIDNTPPELTLIGNNKVIIPLNSSFKEPGFKAIDNIDGNLDKSVKKEGSVDSSKVGKYTIKYSVKDAVGNSTTKTREVIVTTFATARLGLLADALVEIYKLDDNGTLNLKWKETTSSGSSLSSIGKFNTHAYELESDSIYLYKVIAGSDYDSNNNAQKDTKYIENRGIISAIATTDAILNAKNNFNITLLSETAYELSKKSIKYNYKKADFIANLNDISKSLIKADINGDLAINLIDILEFTPTKDMDKIDSTLKANYQKYVDLIHQDKKPILHISHSLNIVATFDFARSITKSIDNSKLYIADGTSGITVVDIDNNRVIKNVKTLDFARKIALNSDETIAYVADSKKGFSVVDLSGKRVLANIPIYKNNELNSSKIDFDARDVVLNDNKDIAYVAVSQKGVLVIDISAPSIPKIIKQIDTPDIAYDIELLDSNTLLVADGKSGLLAINIDDNKTLDTLNTYGSANSVTLSKDKTKAYIADGYKGVVIVDISDIENISYLSHVDTPDFASKVILNSSETKAYIADRKSNIQVVDLTKDKPQIISNIKTGYRSYDLILSSDESSAFVATGTNGLEQVATSSIKNPAIIKQIPTDYRAYKIEKNANNIFVTQGYAGLQVLDKDFNILSTLNTPGFALDMLIDGETLYLADGYKGLQKIDITDTSNPTIIETFSAKKFISSIKLLPDNKTIILSDDIKGVKLVDKDSFTLIDTLNLNSIKSGDITLIPNSKKAYVALGSSGVAVVDYSNNSLKLEETLNFGNYIKHITLSKDASKAFMLGDGNITVVNPMTNKVVNNIELNGFSSSAALSTKQDLLFVANDNSGVNIVNLSRSESIGSIDCGDKVRDIKIVNNILYAATNSAGSCIIDLDILF